MRMEVRTYGDPVLRERGRPIEQFDADLRRLADDMIETMNGEQGVGLAAQQVGFARMLCVVQVSEEHDTNEEGQRENPGLAMPLVMVNPVITTRSEDDWTFEEGCLSFPGLTGPVPRPWLISFAYQDLDGRRHEAGASGFVARVIQHEVDHLNGVLFIDHMGAVKRVALAGRLKRMRRETREHLGLA